MIHGVKVFTPLMLAQNTECYIVITASISALIVGGTSVPYSVTKYAGGMTPHTSLIRNVNSKSHSDKPRVFYKPIITSNDCQDDLGQFC